MNESYPFRDVSGRWLTQALFPETSTNDTYLKYRLRDGVGKKYQHLPVLKYLYLDMLDYTEYRFANKYLGGWEHWQRLCDNALIGREIEKWREELEVKLVSLGLMQINDVALDPENKGRLTAAKFLAEKGFKPKRSAGAPSKKEKERELRVQTKVSDSVADDLERLRSIQ